MEECAFDPRTNTGPTRSLNVSCAQNDSKAIFIPHQAFYEKVLYDTNIEREMKFDCAFKEHFYNSRVAQHQ